MWWWVHESLECGGKCISHWNVEVNVRVTKMWWGVYESLECDGECMSERNVVVSVWVTLMWWLMSEWLEWGGQSMIDWQAYEMFFITHIFMTHGKTHSDDSAYTHLNDSWLSLSSYKYLYSDDSNQLKMNMFFFHFVMYLSWVDRMLFFVFSRQCPIALSRQN